MSAREPMLARIANALEKIAGLEEKWQNDIAGAGNNEPSYAEKRKAEIAEQVAADKRRAAEQLAQEKANDKARKAAQKEAAAERDRETLARLAEEAAAKKAAEEAIFDEPVVEAKPVTLEEVRAVCTDLAKTIPRDSVLAIIKTTTGAPYLKDVKPEQYQDLLLALKKALPESV